MKKILLLAPFILGSLSHPVFAQAPDSTFTERYLLDFVVPDMPAFKALGTDPSNVLRPADAKKFAVTLSPFYSNGKAVIPKNFAIEFSPWKLASSNWTLEQYRENGLKRFLYRSSFSIGTVEDTTDYPDKLALGYRVSFLSKRGDVLRIADNIIANMQASQAAFVALTNYWVINIIKAAPADRPVYYRDHQDDFNKFLSTLSENLNNNPDPNLKQAYDNFINSISGSKLTADELKDYVETFGKGVDDFIEKYKEENWNASRVDLAIAWVGQSSSEALKSSQFSSFNLWLTWAIRAHKNGQVLLGTNFKRPRSLEDKSTTKWSANLRYYAGIQSFRGFFETQYQIDKSQAVEKTLLLNLGAELRIGSKFWLSASGGLNNYLAESNPFNKLVSSIDLKYGFNDPGKK